MKILNTFTEGQYTFTYSLHDGKYQWDCRVDNGDKQEVTGEYKLTPWELTEADKEAYKLSLQEGLKK